MTTKAVTRKDVARLKAARAAATGSAGQDQPTPDPDEGVRADAGTKPGKALEEVIDGVRTARADAGTKPGKTARKPKSAKTKQDPPPDNDDPETGGESAGTAPPEPEPAKAEPPPHNEAARPPGGDKSILDPRDHMSAARAMVVAHYTDAKGRRTLQRFRGAFYRWTGSYYHEADDEAVDARAWSFLDAALRPGKDGGPPEPFKPNKASVFNLVEALKSICQIDPDVDPPFWLDAATLHPAATEIFACANGLLHVPTRQLLLATPDYFGLNASEVMFDPAAPKPRRWLGFLQQLHPADTESIETLQELFGYSLTPDTSHQKIGLVVGPKRGGKGTIARVLTALLGTTAVAAPTISSLATAFGLWPLIGRNLAIISDARFGAKTDKAAIVERLLSISGEDEMNVDRKFKQPWKGRLSVRFIVMTNELPSFSDGSGALASRFVVIVLTQSFYGREDLTLTKKLTAELSGILNWAMDGHRRLQKRGHFIQPKSSVEAVDAIQMLASPVKAFVRDCCDVGPGLTVTVDLLYAAWSAWCSAKGRDPSSEQWFGRDLHSALMPGLKVSRPREGEKRERIYEGIAIHAGAVQAVHTAATKAASDETVTAIRNRAPM